LVDDAHIALKAGEVRNASAPYLLAALDQMGVESCYGGLVKDDIAHFTHSLQAHLSDSDVVISTGAVSVGRYDFVPEALQRLGARILFHRVKMRPGYPTLYARFPDGTHYFGLAGNPVSSIVGLRFLVLPLLRHLMGFEAEIYPQAELANDVRKPLDFCLFQKAQRLSDGRVRLLSGQESFKLKPLLEMDCWAMLDADKKNIASGERITIAECEGRIES